MLMSRELCAAGKCCGTGVLSKAADSAGECCPQSTTTDLLPITDSNGACCGAGFLDGVWPVSFDRQLVCMRAGLAALFMGLRLQRLCCAFQMATRACYNNSATWSRGGRERTCGHPCLFVLQGAACAAAPAYRLMSRARAALPLVR